VSSKELKQVATQRELDLYRQPEPNSMPIEIIRKKVSSGQAFTLACDSCGAADQTIYGFVGIDAGTFSKIKSGTATLQANLISKFTYAVNNTIYSEWLAYQVGCQLVQIETETQRMLRIREEELEAERKENELLRKLLIGRAV
jgi:hypothetical protein